MTKNSGTNYDTGWTSIVPAAGGTFSGPIDCRITSAGPFSNGLTLRKRGQTGNSAGNVLSGSEIGYHSFTAWDGVADGRAAYVLVGAVEDFVPGAHGGVYKIAVTAPGAADAVVRVSIYSTNVALSEGTGLSFGTATGSKIGLTSSEKLAFFGSTPVARPTVTGSRSSGAALTSLLSTLATLGLITDGTTA